MVFSSVANLQGMRSMSPAPEAIAEDGNAAGRIYASL